VFFVVAVVVMCVVGVFRIPDHQRKRISQTRTNTKHHADTIRNCRMTGKDRNKPQEPQEPNEPQETRNPLPDIDNDAEFKSLLCDITPPEVMNEELNALQNESTTSLLSPKSAVLHTMPVVESGEVSEEASCHIEQKSPSSNAKTTSESDSDSDSDSDSESDSEMDLIPELRNGAENTPEVFESEAKKMERLYSRSLPDPDSRDAQHMIRQSRNIAEREDIRQENSKRSDFRCYKEQRLIAENVVHTIQENRRVCFQIVYGFTQTGKTGAMCDIMNRLVRSKSACIDCQDGMWLMTGVSSTEWMEQTKKRVPHFMRKRVVHLPDLAKLGKRLRKQQNVVILVDEAHVAYKQGMSVDKLLNTLLRSTDAACGKDLLEMCRRNISIVFFTATPNLLQQEIKNQVWPDGVPCFQEHILRPGEGYVGIEYLLKKNQLKQCQNMGAGGNRKMVLQAEKAIDQFQKTIKKRFADHPRYHIVRTLSGKKQKCMTDRIRKVLGDIDYDYENFESRFNRQSHPLKALQKMLATPPSKHTILFVKEGLRCAVTLNKKHLGVLYDRIPATTKPDGSTLVQSFAGRATGYDKHDMVIFTDIKTVRAYLALVKSEFREQGNFRFAGSSSKQSGGPCPSTYLSLSQWMEPALVSEKVAGSSSGCALVEEYADDAGGSDSDSDSDSGSGSDSDSDSDSDSESKSESESESESDSGSGSDSDSDRIVSRRRVQSKQTKTKDKRKRKRKRTAASRRERNSSKDVHFSSYKIGRKRRKRSTIHKNE
jgi:hypothetical protein